MNEKEGIVLVPLVNLEISENLIKLDDTLSIRHIEPQELEDLLKKSLDYYPIMRQALMDTKFVIEKKIANTHVLRAILMLRIWDENSIHIQKIALTLRLLGISDFKVPTAFSILHNSFHISNQTPQPSHFKAPSYLSKQLIAEFIELWCKVSSLDNEDYLEFPLSQFNRSFTEGSIEAALIDCVTSFESIVFHSEKSTPRPIGPVIGIAIGMLIGANAEERKEIRKTLVEAYETRNTIVHGHLNKGEMDYTDEKTLAFYDKVIEYLRRSLRKLVEE